MKVALGGTFDPVHDGHRALFETAFERGDVTIGLTTDELARGTRPEGRYVRPYADRKADLETEFEMYRERYDRDFEIRRLTKPTGIAVEPQFNVLVVSPETKAGGERINEIRKGRDLDTLDIVVVDHVRAEDGEFISSSRILRGEIDEHGNVTPDASGRPKRQNVNTDL